MTTQTIIITGANRGIGLELAKQLHSEGHTVIGLVRKGSTELEKLGIRVIDNVDVTDLNSIQTAKSLLKDISIDALWNVAGAMTNEQLSRFDDPAFKRMTSQFEINTLGPLRVTNTFLDQVKDGGKIIMMTSRMGSIDDNDSGGRYGYRMSKAALNAAAKSLAIDLHARRIAVGIFHPGWVKTDMTGHTGMMNVQESAKLLIQRAGELDMKSTGQFVHANGERLPW